MSIKHEHRYICNLVAVVKLNRTTYQRRGIAGILILLLVLLQAMALNHHHGAESVEPDYSYTCLDHSSMGDEGGCFACEFNLAEKSFEPVTTLQLYPPVILVDYSSTIHSVQTQGCYLHKELRGPPVNS